MKVAKNWLELLTGFSLVILVLATFLQVVFRFLLKIPAPWTEEVTRIAFAYLVFFGAALGAKYQRHLSVDVLTTVPAAVRKWVVALGYLLSILFVAVFAYFGWVHTVNSSIQTTPTLEISLSYLYMVMPLSGIIIIYYLIKNMMLEWQGRDVNN
ncbi:MAG: TRAP transporter small permease [Brevibacillus sp.]|nr:TRAP transporter small permease [Brevibacillus sp.]